MIGSVAGFALTAGRSADSLRRPDAGFATPDHYVLSNTCRADIRPIVPITAGLVEQIREPVESASPCSSR